MDHPKKLRDLILKKAEEKRVVFQTYEGLHEADLEEFIKQPIEGILYDLNQDKSTILAFTEDHRWVNNLAVNLVISRLKEHYDNSREK